LRGKCSALGPQGLKPFAFNYDFKGTAEEAAEKVTGQKVRTRGLKPVLIPDTLRGAEAPLFHVTARIPELFRSL
jgi:hypothetical protein